MSGNKNIGWRADRRAAAADAPVGSVLVFRDPDNVQLERFCPADR